MNRRFLAVVTGGCALASAACYDLDVTAIQPAAGAAYTREDVIRQPHLMELVVGGLFINFWGGATYAQPWFHLAAFGEEVTSSATDAANFNRGATQRIIIWDMIREHEGTSPAPNPPRRAQFDNSLTGSSLFARDPWSNFYEANAAATEIPRLVRQNNLRIINQVTGDDNTHRVLTFAKWLQGMSHVHLAMLFDSAAVINEDVDLSTVPVLPFKPYREVLDSGVKWLEQSIAMTRERSFVFPFDDDQWIYNSAVTNDELAAIAHSYIARALAYSARTPAEREDVSDGGIVDWARVKEHILAGVTGNFGPRGFPNPIISFDFRQLMTSAPLNTTAICNGFCTHAGEARVDLRLLGPADSSGRYQIWLDKVSKAGFDTVTPFIIETRDERIQPSTVSVPANKPTYFKFTADPPSVNVMPPERGAYYWSNYWSSSRALDNRTSQLPRDGGGRNRRNTADLGAIQDAMLLKVEMDLLLAEAEFRLGNRDAAAALINQSRLANGGAALGAVTAAGVPVSTGCVPRRYDGTCGGLWDALVYEKRIETYGTAISFFDLRGWGCLIEGTLIQLPPPGRQLDLLGKLIYSFGGSGPNAAPRPTNCPLLHKPNPA